MAAVRVVFENGSKRTFASAVDWPGWCRAGKDEQLALESLIAYAPRYAAVPKAAGVPFTLGRWNFDVLDHLRGDATTDFGAPGAMARIELQPMSKAEVERMCSLVEATWKVFDGIVKKAPASLRKGPRGGGRDRDKIVEHVLGAEAGYGSSFALKLNQPAVGDLKAIRALREAWLEAFRAGADGKPRREGGRSARYMARRIAWHAMDHAWEIEDRSES
ncbi:MAG TPA: hypothetical protein VGV88_11655 [Candidatus Dormibacteraeota bacterium]|nr:hypothetical protein [Candidatus Dormibacteraeota bacterium]